MTDPRLTLTFNDDGTIDTNLDEDIPANALILGLSTVLAGFIEEWAPNDTHHDLAIDIVTAELARTRPQNTFLNAKQVQGILGDGWLDGKTRVELVKEHREGRA